MCLLLLKKGGKKEYICFLHFEEETLLVKPRVPKVKLALSIQ